MVYQRRKMHMAQPKHPEILTNATEAILYSSVERSLTSHAYRHFVFSNEATTILTQGASRTFTNFINMYVQIIDIK